MMYFHEKLQNASKIKDSTFNVFNDISGFRKLTKLCLTILEMAICCHFMLKVNFFDTQQSFRKNAKYMCKLFFGPDSSHVNFDCSFQNI